MKTKIIAVILFTTLLAALFAGCESKEAKKIPTVTVNEKDIRISVTTIEEVVDEQIKVGYSSDGSFEEYDINTNDLKLASAQSYNNIELAQGGVSFATITISNYTQNQLEFKKGVIYDFSAPINDTFRKLNIKINGQDVYGKSLTELQLLFEGSVLSDDGTQLVQEINVDDKYDYKITFTASGGASADHVDVDRVMNKGE